jgi:hypothetical protein
VPWVIPAAGAVVCVGLIAGRLADAYRRDQLTGDLLTTATIFAAILVLYWTVRPKEIPEAP